jgi:hypothetical protein
MPRTYGRVVVWAILMGTEHVHGSQPGGNPMASHRVRMSVPEFDIGGSNVEFVVESNRRTASGDLEKLGELHISKGSLEWWPKGAKRYRREVKWERFAEWIEETGRRY